MQDIIYHFSGTGNSLFAAKKIGEALDLPVMHIADKEASRELTEANTIGIVFPVYAWGMPAMVENFIKSCTFSKESYIFAIAMCGGNAAGTLKDCAKAIEKRGGRLSAGFAVRNSTTPDTPDDELKGIIKLVKKLSGPSHERFEGRKDEIMSILKQRASHPVELSKPLGNIVGSFIHSKAKKIFLAQDKNFSMSSSCIQCGFCTRVCPAENITIEDGTLTWHGKCQQCYSCKAVCEHDGIAVAGDAYPGSKLHPQIDRKELLLR